VRCLTFGVCALCCTLPTVVAVKGQGKGNVVRAVPADCARSCRGEGQHSTPCQGCALRVLRPGANNQVARRWKRGRSPRRYLKTARTKSVRWPLNESDRSPRRGDRDLASYRDPVSRREIRGNGLLDHGARARPATLPAAPGRDQAGERQHEPASLQRHATPRRTAPPDSSPASTSSSRPAARRGCGRPTRSTSGGAPRSRTRARTGSCARAERCPGSRSGA
jgi:hypothetical protein